MLVLLVGFAGGGSWLIFDSGMVYFAGCGAIGIGFLGIGGV